MAKTEAEKQADEWSRTLRKLSARAVIAVTRLHEEFGSTRPNQFRIAALARPL